MKRVLGNIMLVVIVLAVVVVALISVRTHTRMFVVKSGSMTPTIQVDDAVLVKPQAVYRPGDIISFTSHHGNVVTHRIIGVKSDGSFMTKGDANAAADQWPLDRSAVIGKEYLVIPWIGKLWLDALVLVSLVALYLWLSWRPSSTGRHFVAHKHARRPSRHRR